jgi:hypothetical protein
MGCFDDEDRELDEAAKPYLEPLIDALESNWNTVSSNGICATVEWEGPKVLMMSVLVVPDQGVYEFECIGPDSHETGTFPLGDEKSIARLVEMTKDISAMNIAASGNKPYSGVSDGLDVLAKLRQEIVEFTDDGPPRPDFRRYVDVDGLDKLCCYIDRVDGGGLEYEVIFFIEGENLVAQYVHHIWDEEEGGWRGEPDQWRDELWLFGPTVHEDAIGCLIKVWHSIDLMP